VSNNPRTQIFIAARKYTGRRVIEGYHNGWLAEVMAINNEWGRNAFSNVQRPGRYWCLCLEYISIYILCVCLFVCFSGLVILDFVKVLKFSLTFHVLHQHNNNKQTELAD
jgi:hypothetical protein